MPAPTETRQAVLERFDRALAQVPLEAVVHVQPDRRPAEPHQCHPVPRLTIVTSGRKHLLMGGVDGIVERHVPAGTGLFMAPRAWTLPRYDSAREILGIVFRPDYTRFLWSRHDGRSPPPAQGPNLWFHVPRAIGGSATHALQTLATRSREVRREPSGLADVRLFEGLVRLAREHLARAEDQARGGGALATWQALCEHVRDHHHEPIDRGSVARAFALHPNYVSTLFASQGGETFARFLTRVRLERAAELLRQPGAVVSEVAAAVGYADAGYFVKAFRRAYGTTPGRYGRGGA